MDLSLGMILSVYLSVTLYISGAQGRCRESKVVPSCSFLGRRFLFNASDTFAV